jgi:predicted enzyme related to lactoylglutathione lyase
MTTNPIGVLGIHHVSLCVDDIAAADQFYEHVMGFTRLTNRPDFGIGGTWLQAGAQQVHLIELPGNAKDKGRHFALHVTDLDAAIATIEARGGEVTRSPINPDMAAAGRQAFLNDPSGNVIELNEPIPGA